MTTIIKYLFQLPWVISAISIALLITLGCENTPTEVEKYNPEPVLSAFLVNGQLFEEAWLERVSPVLDAYNFSNSGIDNATIIITNAIGDTLNLVPDAASKGRYIPAAGDSMMIQGLVSYRIDAWTPAPYDEHLWATSLVPGSVEQREPMRIFLLSDDGQTMTPVADGDTLNRGMDKMIWTWGDIDSAGGFQGIIFSETPRDELIPLDPDWDPNDPDDELEEEDRERAGWTFMRYDQRQISVAWIFFDWVGPQKISFYALSRDYYEYVFSSLQAEFGAVERPTINIHGGLGIFGAYSEHSIRIYMEKVEN